MAAEASPAALSDALMAPALVPAAQGSPSFSVMVSWVTRTGTTRPGPHTSSTIGRSPAGTGLVGALEIPTLTDTLAPATWTPL